MPMKSKTTSTRRPRRKTQPRRARRTRYPRNNRKNVPEWASCSVTRTILPAAGQNFAANNMYEVHNVRLIDYDRAETIGLGYQFYRIKNVKLTFKFPYDTYQAGVSMPARIFTG